MRFLPDAGRPERVLWDEAAWKIEDTQRGARTQAIRDWVGRWPKVMVTSMPEHIAGVASGLHHQSTHLEKHHEFEAALQRKACS